MVAVPTETQSRKALSSDPGCGDGGMDAHAETANSSLQEGSNFLFALRANETGGGTVTWT
jgi:hypothetical protein